MYLIGALEVLRADLLDKAGNVDVDGAAADAGRLLAVEAALGLVQRHLLGVAQGDLGSFCCALGSRLLRGHGVLFDFISASKRTS